MGSRHSLGKSSPGEAWLLSDGPGLLVASERQPGLALLGQTLLWAGVPSPWAELSAHEAGRPMLSTRTRFLVVWGLVKTSGCTQQRPGHSLGPTGLEPERCSLLGMATRPRRPSLSCPVLSGRSLWVRPGCSSAPSQGGHLGWLLCPASGAQAGCGSGPSTATLPDEPASHGGSHLWNRSLAGGWGP